MRERDDALAAIPRLLENLPADRIVLGDFNATPWNAPFRRLLRTTGLAEGSTAWWLPSWPDPLPAPLRIPIDHVLTAGELRVVDAFVGASFGSDHRPIGAVIRHSPR
ncbi:MAG TPA: endonuclease/exonuclease/phosphatase family protein [bacterium]|nr:endonuclease/exonuclease/phosphatase family protein [bacterium]